MSKHCDFCGKGPVSGNKVSHSNIKTRTRWLPNLKRMKALVKGATQTVRACTRCIRSGKIQRPPVRTWKPETSTKTA